MNGKATGKYRTLDELSNDLFVDKVYISLGYDEEDYSTDSIVLYSNSGSEYSSYDGTTKSEADIKAANQKVIEARWILHTDEAADGILAIDKENEIPEGAEIHWYRQTLNYKPPKDIPHYLGDGWEELAHEGEDKLTFNFNPRINYATEFLKCVIVYPTQVMCNDQIADEISLLTGSPGDVDYDAAVSTIKAKHKPVATVSPEIGFKNILLPRDVSSVNMAKGLSILVDVENQNGKYFLYGPTNEITSRNEEAMSRKMVAVYNPVINDGLTIADNATQIKWEIPLVNTMIERPVQDVDYFTSDNVPPPAEINGGEFLIITRDRLVSTEDPTKFESLNPYQTFKIKPYYVQNATNNTIKCTITFDNGNVCVAEANLLFGQSGNSGTDATFVLGFQNGTNSIKFRQEVKGNLVSYQADPVFITASLFDYENKDVTANYNNIKWEWYSKMRVGRDEVEPLTLVTSGEGIPANGCKIEYNPQGNPYNAMGYILKGSVQYRVTNKVALNPNEINSETASSETEEHSASSTVGGTTSAKEKIVTLSAFLPIPINFDNYAFAEAPSRIIYDSSGTNPAFYNNYLQLFKYDESLKKNVAIGQCEWLIGVDGEYSYKPVSTSNMSEAEKQDIANISEDNRKAANWKAYYPTVVIATEEYAPPDGTITADSYPKGKQFSITVNENLTILATVIDSQVDVTTSTTQNNSGESIITTITKLNVIDELILKDGKGAQIKFTEDNNDSFQLAIDTLIELGYKGEEKDAIIPEGDSFRVKMTYLLDETITDENGSNLGDNNDLSTGVQTDGSTVSVLGPKVQAPNMYYNDLKKCVYLNCYTYYEREADDPLEDYTSSEANNVADEDVDENETQEYDGYVIRPIYSQADLDAGKNKETGVQEKYYILQDTYVNFKGMESFDEDIVYYKSIDFELRKGVAASILENHNVQQSAINAFLEYDQGAINAVLKLTFNEVELASLNNYIYFFIDDENFEPLGSYDADEEFNPISQADLTSLIASGTQIYELEEKFIKAPDPYQDEVIYYIAAAVETTEGDESDTEDSDSGSNPNTTPDVDDTPYEYGATDVYGNLLPTPGKKVLAWSQPIIIEQNRYPSAMLNAWNGELTIDEKNGTILSSMIAAGKKEDDNSFTGVILGDVSADIGTHTGVYGFEHGEQCYAFKDDGKAFIGKSGSGQINFDGNKGEIKSGSYDKHGTTSGMMIDLDGGGTEDADKGPYIHMVGAYGETRIGTESPYFEIKSRNGFSSGVDDKQGVKTLLYIGAKNDSDDKSDYYLQTANYGTTSVKVNITNSDGAVVLSKDIPVGTGTKLDLKNGEFLVNDNFLLTGMTDNYSNRAAEDDTQKYYNRGITLSSGKEKPYLKITKGMYHVIENNEVIEIDKEIININNNESFLQSAEWLSQDTGMKITLAEGEKNDCSIHLKNTYTTMVPGQLTDPGTVGSEVEVATPAYCQYCGEALTDHDEIISLKKNGGTDNITFDFSNVFYGEKPSNTTDTTYDYLTLKDIGNNSALCFHKRIHYKDEYNVDNRAFYIIQDSDNKLQLARVWIGVKGEEIIDIGWNWATISEITPLFYCDFCGYRYQKRYNYFLETYFNLSGSFDDNFITNEKTIDGKEQTYYLEKKTFTFKKCDNEETENEDGSGEKVCPLNRGAVTFNPPKYEKGDGYFIRLKPATPYFEIGYRSAAADEKKLIHIGDSSYYLKSLNYNYSTSGTGSNGNGMYIKLSNDTDGSTYIIGENSYILLSKSSTAKSATNLTGIKQVYISGSGATSYPIHVRYISSIKSGSVNYNTLFRVSWSGAVVARSFHIIGKDNQTFCFAGGVDAYTRFPVTVRVKKSNNVGKNSGTTAGKISGKSVRIPYWKN